MPRRLRCIKDFSCYHITHRCHKREFLFRFARDRQVYVDLLREMVGRFEIDVLNYVVTSNHIHLLVWVRRGEELSRAMQFLHGEFGQYYNLRKEREGAFWRDRFHGVPTQMSWQRRRCRALPNLVSQNPFGVFDREHGFSRSLLERVSCGGGSGLVDGNTSGIRLGPADDTWCRAG